jgi:hypothetical protein
MDSSTGFSKTYIVGGWDWDAGHNLNHLWPWNGNSVPSFLPQKVERQ